jgi:hypothetical protein
MHIYRSYRLECFTNYQVGCASRELSVRLEEIWMQSKSASGGAFPQGLVLWRDDGDVDARVLISRSVETLSN